MKPKVSENEQYLSSANRITGVIVLLIGLAGVVDILVEWRTTGGLLVGALIGVLMVLTYLGLIRPSVTLRPDGLLVRNHLRDHHVPWHRVEDVDVTDILRVQTPGRRIRCPGVQLVMRDLRRQRAGRQKAGAENSITRADFVVGRVEAHRERHAAGAEGEVTTTWAVPELIVLGVFVLVAVVAQLLR